MRIAWAWRGRASERQSPRCCALPRKRSRLRRGACVRTPATISGRSRARHPCRATVPWSGPENGALGAGRCVLWGAPPPTPPAAEKIGSRGGGIRPNASRECVAATHTVFPRMPPPPRHPPLLSPPARGRTGTSGAEALVLAHARHTMGGGYIYRSRRRALEAPVLPLRCRIAHVGTRSWSGPN